MHTLISELVWSGWFWMVTCRMPPTVLYHPVIWSLDFTDAWGPFYWHGLTLIPTGISNHMPSEVWDEITYPFPNFSGSNYGPMSELMLKIMSKGLQGLSGTIHWCLIWCENMNELNKEVLVPCWFLVFVFFHVIWWLEWCVNSFVVCM